RRRVLCIRGGRTYAGVRRRRRQEFVRRLRADEYEAGRLCRSLRWRRKKSCRAELISWKSDDVRLLSRTERPANQAAFGFPGDRECEFRRHSCAKFATIFFAISKQQIPLILNLTRTNHEQRDRSRCRELEMTASIRIASGVHDPPTSGN